MNVFRTLWNFFGQQILQRNIDKKNYICIQMKVKFEIFHLNEKNSFE